jgi:hypothetical protein
VSETEALFGVLRQSADAGCAAAIEGAVTNAPDHELCRVNALAFATKNKLDEERTIAAFLHAARLGLFELSWNVLCPDCGGVLDAGTTLKTVNHDEYSCALCAAGYKPTLDEMVEVTFTVSPRVRRIAGHDPDTLPEVEYYRQIFWSSGMDLPDDLAASLAEFTIDSIEVPPSAKAVLSVQIPEGFAIVFDPVTHGRQIIAVKGEPTRDRQALSIVFSKVGAPLGTVETEEMRPGPLRLSIENRSDRRVLPALWVSGDALHHLLGKRRPFLTAKRLLRCTKTRRIAAAGLVLAAMSLAVPANATTPAPGIVVAQAMIPRTGMTDAENPMPMNERYLKRFPQPARVGDLIGMPVLDLYSKTLGYVRKVVRTPGGEIKFIVDYSQWWGWFGRLVAVPLEALGIEGGHLVSLDMSPSEFAAAPTWRDTDAPPLPNDAIVRVALSRS